MWHEDIDLTVEEKVEKIKNSILSKKIKQTIVKGLGYDDNSEQNKAKKQKARKKNKIQKNSRKNNR